MHELATRTLFAAGRIPPGGIIVWYPRAPKGVRRTP